ncbi:MAG: DUF3467 domain-containing protein [Patescibacteria group bacterium]|nr:DUF3467 domain-containing protein [Patescibacteria group bacterium]
MTQPIQPQQNQLQIKADDKILQGVYSNAMQVQHSKEEFVIDFMNLFPPAGTLNARVIVSPGHLKRMIAALAENLAKYEGNFGKIDTAQEPAEIGFAAK